MQFGNTYQKFEKLNNSTFRNLSYKYVTHVWEDLYVIPYNTICKRLETK